ncbi:hypothetical protein PENFLA_c083G00942 [Penicillium flavigenum]|uniref:Uncharacterized protein n=1 Tax=Penicillium flavigenum TaxID=254877 RepID=A0A1V6SA94_9EURO|nr:hypothetical protein PENFLA_c083G00942 [Penicillium flavigenum]
MTSTSTTRATATSRVTSKAPADLMVVPSTTVDLAVPAVPAALDLEDLRVNSKDSSSTTRVALEALVAMDNTRVDMVDMVDPVVLREDTVVGKLEMDVLEILEQMC